jgi:hypothetical protein
LIVLYVSSRREATTYHKVVGIARYSGVSHLFKLVAVAVCALVEEDAGNGIVDDKVASEQPDDQLVRRATHLTRFCVLLRRTTLVGTGP